MDPTVAETFSFPKGADPAIGPTAKRFPIRPTPKRFETLKRFQRCFPAPRAGGENVSPSAPSE